MDNFVVLDGMRQEEKKSKDKKEKEKRDGNKQKVLRQYSSVLSGVLK